MSIKHQLGTVTFAILSLLLSVSSQAQEGILQCPPQAKQVIAKAFPSLKFEEYECARGDLDRDGIPDVAAIIQYTSDDIELAQVLILKGSNSGNYSIIAKSDVYGPHMRRDEYASISKGSVFLSASTHTYDEYVGASYQFKLVEKEFVLIGLEETRGGIGEDKPSYSRSVNFLTNRLIEHRRIRGKQIVDQRLLQTQQKTRLTEFTLDNVGGMSFK